jgi:hypothetical protein
VSLGELSARFQRAVDVARVEQQSSTRLALPSCHRSQAARQGRRPISVHASAATIEYVDALCYILRSYIPPISAISAISRYRSFISVYIRMLVEKVPSPALSGTWFGTANATKQHVNVAVAIYIRHRDRER